MLKASLAVIGTGRFGTKLGSKKKSRRAASVSRFAAEPLEARLLLSTVDAWKAAVSADWNVAADWSLGTVPTSSNDVQIEVAGTYTVTMDTADYEVSSLTVGGGASGTQTLTVSGHKLTLDNASSIASNGAVNDNGGTLAGAGVLTNSGTLTMANATDSGSLANQGTLTIHDGSNTISGTLTTNTTSIINLTSDDTNTYSGLTVSTGFTNNHAINLTNNSNNGYYSDLAITTGTLTNSSTGTITVSKGGTDTASEIIAGSVANAGTVNIQCATTFSNSGYTFTNTGSLAVTSGQTLIINDGTFDQDGGTITGGTIDFNSLTLNVQMAYSISGVVFAFSGVTVDGPAALTNSSSSTLTIAQSTINANLANQGTLVIHGSSNFITGTLTTTTTSIINLISDDTYNYSGLTVSTGFTNNHAINLTNNSNNGYYSDLAITTGTLTNSSTGTITVSKGGTDTASEIIAGSVANAGTVNIQCATTFSNSGYTFTNTGSLAITSGQTLIINDGTFDQDGGTITGGTIDFNSLTLNVQMAYTISGVTFVFSGVTVDGPAALTNGTGDTLTIAQSTINANLANQGTLVIHGSSNFITGTLTTTTTSIINLISDDTYNYSGLTVSTGFTNNHAINLTNNSNNGYYSALSITAGTLTNSSTGTITSSKGGTDAQSNVFSGSIANAGTFNVQCATTFSNSGYTFTNTGSLAITSGQTLIINDGTFDQDGGTITGGTIDFNSLTLNVQMAYTISGVTFVFSGVTVDGPAALTNGTGDTLTIAQSTINANLANQGTLVIHGSSNFITGTLTTTTTSIINLISDDTYNYSGLTVSTGFTNNHAINLTNNSNNGYYSALSITAGTLTNSSTGTITSSKGGTDAQSNVFSGSIANAGTFNVQCATTFSNSGFTFTNTKSLAVTSGQTLVINNGTFDQDGGTITGGTIDFNSVAINIQANYTLKGVTWFVSNGSINGPDTLTNASTSTLTLTNVAINGSLTNQGTLVIHGSGTTVPGTLTTATTSIINLIADDTNGYAVITFSTSFTNNGIINLTNNSNNGYYPQIILSSGTLTNAAGATINTTTGATTPKIDYIYATIANAGTIDIDAPTQGGVSNQSFSNTGTLILGPVGNLTKITTFSQTSTGILDFQLGGTPASGNYGQFTISGAATLGGELKSEVVNGYAPTIGDAFTPFHYASETGSFATLWDASAAGYYFQPTVNSTNVVLTAAVPHLAFHVEPPTTETAGVKLAPAVVVWVEDENNNVILGNDANVTITLNSAPPKGTLSGAHSVNAVNGAATFSALTLKIAGLYTLEAAQTGDVSATSTGVTIVHANAKKLIFAAPQTTKGTAGVDISPSLVVDVEDAYGNLVTNDESTVTLTAKNNTPGMLFGTTAVAAVNGVATFSAVYMKTAGKYTLFANDSNTNLTQGVSKPITIVAGSVASLAWVTEPVSTDTAGSILPAMTVEAFDSYNNPVGGVTLTMATASGTGALTGTLTAKTSTTTGIASFSKLILDTAGPYTLEAKDGAIVSPASTSISITPAAANKLVFTTLPTNATHGTAFTVVVSVEDKYGNVETTDNTGTITMTLATHPTGSMLTGTLTENVINGVATFNDLIVSAPGTYSLTASDSFSIASATSSTFHVS